MPETMLDADVIVVGGGLAGLACALGLAGSDLAVTVLERADRLGGRATSFVDETTGDVVDTGPHIVHNHCDNLLAFSRWVGTDAQVVWQDDPLLTVSNGGTEAVDIRTSDLPPPLHLAPAMLAVPDLTLTDKLSSVVASLRAMALDARTFEELDKIPASDFLRDSGCSPRVMQWFWATAAMTINALPLEQCSAAALLRFYQQLIGHPDLRIGVPGVGLRDWLAEPARHLIEHHENRVRTGVSAVALHGCDDGTIAVELDDGLRLRARQVVCAVPPAELQALARLADGSPLVPALDAFVPSPYVCCYLWFDRKVTDRRYWTRTTLSQPLNYDWYDLSNIRPGADQRSLIASNIIYSSRAGAMSDDEIVEATVCELAEFEPGARAAHLRHARVHRIAFAIPCARPGVERHRPDARTRLANVYLAGDWTNTGLPFSMESAVRSGWLAAEAVRYDAGCPCPKALAHPIPTLRGATEMLHRAPPAVSTLLGL